MFTEICGRLVAVPFKFRALLYRERLEQHSRNKKQERAEPRNSRNFTEEDEDTLTWMNRMDRIAQRSKTAPFLCVPLCPLCFIIFVQKDLWLGRIRIFEKIDENDRQSTNAVHSINMDARSLSPPSFPQKGCFESAKTPKLPSPSFPRRRESRGSRVCVSPCQAWIPAFAGMTEKGCLYSRNDSRGRLSHILLTGPFL